MDRLAEEQQDLEVSASLPRPDFASEYRNLVSCDVASCRSEALGVGAHENVHVPWVAVVVVDHTAAVRAQGADTVSLINI